MNNISSPWTLPMMSRSCRSVNLKRCLQSGMLLLLAAACPLQAETRNPATEPTKAYRKETIHGFTVLTNPGISKQQNIPAYREELSRQLEAIASAVPRTSLAKLRKVRIWVEWNTRHSAAEFHPSRDWLKSNGYNPDKAGHVEISNLRHFVDWSAQNQPSMILHEMAHAYQYHVLGNDHAGVRKAYRNAVQKKNYEKVAYSLGGTKRAYALENELEYFAELTEAYFGENDFYPFRRAELKTHDPAGFALMQSVWK